MDVAELLHLALNGATEQGVRFVHVRHVPEPQFLELASSTHRFLWENASTDSDRQGWRVHKGGILRWWGDQGGLNEEDSRRLHKFRSDIVDFLTAQGLVYRSHPQSNHLHVAPYTGNPDNAATITVSSSGAGFGDPDQNREVEVAAMRAVTEHYAEGGWDVEDVSRAKCGWDLTCWNHAEGARHLEVKGVAGFNPTILLTANEHNVASTDPEWRLAIVVNALTQPSVTEYAPNEVAASAEPYVYRCTL